MTADAVRCPSCGAHNPARADWCSLCFASLRPEPEPEQQPPPPPPAGPVASDPPITATGAAGATDAPVERREPGADGPAAIVTAGDGRFRRIGDDIEWACTRCDAWNPMERLHCDVCGAAFHERFERPDDPEQQPPAVPVGVLMAMSLLAPGSGHLVLRRYATAIGRLLMFLLWAIGGLLLLSEARATGQSALPAVPLLLGAVGLSLVSAYDVVAAAQGSSHEILGPRVFLWSVVAVIGSTLMAFVGSVLRVT